MPRFSRKSKKNLESCHKDLHKILNEVIKYIDFSVIFGHRMVRKQFDLFKKGREYNKETAEWIIVDKSKVVTYCDGHYKRSKHNYKPSVAVDIVPYPTMWNDMNEIHKLARAVKNTARDFDINIIWGGDWHFKDYAHFELSHY